MSKKKLLVIDDSVTVLSMLKEVFKEEGYNVILSETGEDGVKKTKKENPDIVIIDTLLPGIDGFEVCIKIKELKQEKQPKIVMMTGAIDAIDAVKARKSGADEYCAKTCDFEPLIEAVKRLA